MNHEGTLRIVHLDTDRRSGKPQYSVTYVPYSRGGGALPRRLQEMGILESVISYLST